jgi:class 3 adenylate cyclase
MLRDVIGPIASADRSAETPRRRDSRTLLVRVASIGMLPDDSDEVRIHKATLTLTSLSIALLAFIWVAVYVALGRPLSAAIPGSYQVVSFASLAWFARSKRYDTLRITQTLLILVLPFLLQWSLGGYVNGSAVMVWAFAAPMGALVFGGARSALITFGAFAALAALSGVLDPWLAAGAEPVPDAIRVTFFVLDIVGVATVTFLVLVYFVSERQRVQHALDGALHALRIEQDRSEGLLANMLPPAVAARLKSGDATVADAYPSVTVVFVDLVDSTPLASRLAPAELVHLLDQIYSALDELALRLGLTKIKTAGDSYLAVAGIPVERSDHAEAAADFALAVAPALAATLDDTGHRVQTRIGLHSGPVVAGVIGRRTFAYDVWGETVNIASRMESQGVAGAIQVSSSTAERLGARYHCRIRGDIEVKGIGTMTTYLLGPAEGGVPFPAA